MDASLVVPGPLAFSSVGMLAVLVIVLLIFGNRLPTLMRSLGRSVVEFKKGIGDVDDEEDQKTIRS